MNHGMEDWHPNPTFFYQPGGGPVLDIGPYYVTALVNLIGPVRRVCAFAARAFEERIVTAEPRYVERVPVEVQTHVAGTLEFACGAIVTVTVTWDVWAERPYQLNLYGTEGSLLLPDPNFFGGATAISRKGSPFEPVEPAGPGLCQGPTARRAAAPRSPTTASSASSTWPAPSRRAVRTAAPASWRCTCWRC